MYNRYIRNDSGGFTRIQEEDAQANRPSEAASQASGQQQSAPFQEHAPQNNPRATGRTNDGLTGFLRHILDQLHLDSIDTGDLILLGLLFFLSREDADEELLIALGLLLIL